MRNATLLCLTLILAPSAYAASDVDASERSHFSSATASQDDVAHKATDHDELSRVCSGEEGARKCFLTKPNERKHAG